MSAKDSLTSTSIRRSAWAEQLLTESPGAATATQNSRDTESEAKSQQFFAQVLRNLDRLEKLTAEQEPSPEAVEGIHADGYEWAQLVDPTGTAAMAPRLARSKASSRKLPIVSLNLLSFALLASATVTQSWWPLPAAAFAAAGASLLYLRGCRGSWRLRSL
jgi:hypothetical protein